MMKIIDICNRINACSSTEQLEQTKKQIISKLDSEHENKMSKFNSLKARHDKELETISKEIKEAIASKDFSKVQTLLKEQAELITKQNAEMLSVM